MIIDIPNEFFEGPDKEKPNKVLFITRLLDNGHYIQCHNVDLIYDLFEKWGSEMECEFLADSIEYLSPNKKITEFLTTINLTDYNELQLKVLLFKPSELLVEFAPYEWNVYKRIVKAYVNDPNFSSVFTIIKKQIDNFNLVPENAGGYASIPAMIELKNNGEYYHLYNRKTCVIFDRDKENGTEIDSNKKRLFELFVHKPLNEISNSDVYKLDYGTDYIWHMWYKRAIENYFSPEQYESLGAKMDKVRNSAVDYDYYYFDVNDTEVGYKKTMMRDVGRGLSRNNYESSLKRFTIENIDCSEFQLLLLKIAKIV